MLKIEIEGVEVHYKNVSDLHEKVQENLTEVRGKRVKAAAELKALNRREKALRRFLGIQKPAVAMAGTGPMANQVRPEKQP